MEGLGKHTLKYLKILGFIILGLISTFINAQEGLMPPENYVKYRDSIILKRLVDSIKIADTTSYKNIINGLDWRSSPNSVHEKLAGQAVGLLSIPSRGVRCTASIVSKNIILTNAHCISSASSAKGANITLLYDPGAEISNINKRHNYKCEKFLYADEDLDYALIKCDEDIGDKYGVLTFTAREFLPKGSEIFVIHQNCDHYNDVDCNPTKKYSSGIIILNSQYTSSIYYSADTLGGSSGSPVFYKNPITGKYYIVGLHNSGSESANIGTKSKDILEDIEKHLKD